MSSLVVQVSLIGSVSPHPNADRLELAIINGWQCVVPKGRYSVGDRVVYFPPDTVLPEEVSDRMGVTQYLSKGRIRCARLRGEPSFGVVEAFNDEAWEVGDDVAALYGATKYEPPLRVSVGDCEAEHPLFQSYTDIENLRNFQGVLQDGESVVVTEKIHGTNSRIGLLEGTLVAGSKKLQRKMPSGELMAQHEYWFPYTLEPVKALITELAAQYRQVVIYGEVFGKIQKRFHYDAQGTLGYRAFDILVDGRYMDHEDFCRWTDKFGVQRVPVLYEGPYSLEKIKELSSGTTTIGDAHIREGVVVKPVKERINEKIGRVILKYVSDAYLLGDTDDNTDA